MGSIKQLCVLVSTNPIGDHQRGLHVREAITGSRDEEERSRGLPSRGMSALFRTTAKSNGRAPGGDLAGAPSEAIFGEGSKWHEPLLEQSLKMATA